MTCVSVTGGVRAAGPVLSYTEHIHPILDKHCIQCHGRWFPKGGLRLHTVEATRKGGNSGPGVIPGEPEKGWLMFSILPRKARPPLMPPSGPYLDDEEIEQLQEWIRQGAR